MPYRDSYSNGFPGPRLTPWVKRTMIALTAVFLAVFVADYLVRLSLSPRLALIPAALGSQPWSLLTFPFLHSDPITLLFILLTLFFFGGPLEERWGGRGYLQFCAASLAGSVLAALLLGVASPGMARLPLTGFTGAIYGMLLALALYWPDMEINIWGIIPVKAKWLALLAAVIGFIVSVQSGGQGLAHLGAFATAFLFLKSPWAPRGWGELPAPRPARPARTRAAVPWLGQRESAAPRPPTPTLPIRSARAEQELFDDVDRILDKISAEGLAALSEDERKRLDEVSRQYRTN